MELAHFSKDTIWSSWFNLSIELGKELGCLTIKYFLSKFLRVKVGEMWTLT